MKELSIFVDESGDFGEYSSHSPYYIISMVYHEQNADISKQVRNLDDNLIQMGLTNMCIHTGPIIRREEDYENLSIPERRRILNALLTFVKHIDIKYACFYVEKKQVEDRIDMAGKLSKQISMFIRNNYEYFVLFDVVKVYYDNGQTEVTRILSSVFNALLNEVKFKKATPLEYKLSQVADFMCTMEMLSLKSENMGLSRGELKFFGSKRELRKQYLKYLEKKRIR